MMAVMFTQTSVTMHTKEGRPTSIFAIKASSGSSLSLSWAAPGPGEPGAGWYPAAASCSSWSSSK